MIYESIINRRTTRKFTQQPVPPNVLQKCVDAARLSPAGGNVQPLKYIAVNEEKYVSQVFSTLKNWTNIPEYKVTQDEMPTAYIVILLDRKIREGAGHDAGIAVMSISMVAYEEGVASCIFGSVDRPRLKEMLKIPDQMQPLLVMALGYPAEKPKAVEMEGNDTQYWLDGEGVLNVPKRKLENILIWNSY